MVKVVKWGTLEPLPKFRIPRPHAGPGLPASSYYTPVIRSYGKLHLVFKIFLSSPGYPANKLL